MDCDIIKSNVNIFKTALDGFSEEKINFDIIIPDYCAAADKILKCDVIPVITSKNIENDKLTVEGICTVNILYADENDGIIRSVSESENFIQTYGLKEKLDNYRIKIKTRATNVVCKLQNSRRISAKAIIGIAVKVMGNSQIELLSGFDNCKIETKFEHFDKKLFVCNGETDIRIASEIKAENNVTDIVKCNSNIIISEIKPIKDRVIIKGEIQGECIYTYGENIFDIGCSNVVMPFSEMIDAEGCNEDSICDVVCDTLGVRCDIADSDEQNIINFEFEGRADVCVFENVRIDILQDLYSTECETTFEKNNLSLESLHKSFKFDNKLNQKIEISLDDAIVDNVFVKPLIKNVSVSDKELIIEGDMVISVMVHNSSECKTIDKTEGFKVSEHLDTEFAQLRCEAEAYCIDISTNMTDDNTMYVESNVAFSILLFEKTNYTVICDVNFSDEQDKKRDSKIVLYYAEKGEILWDIAKKYCTSVNIIKRDNNLNSEKINDNCMLLISGK